MLLAPVEAVLQDDDAREEIARSNKPRNHIREGAVLTTGSLDTHYPWQ